MDLALFQIMANHVIGQDMSDSTGGIYEEDFLKKCVDRNLASASEVLRQDVFRAQDKAKAQTFFDTFASEDLAGNRRLQYGFCNSNSHSWEEGCPYALPTPITDDDIARIAGLMKTAGIEN
jgi:hypothetical protein